MHIYNEKGQIECFRGGVTKKNGKNWEKFPKGGGGVDFIANICKTRVFPMFLCFPYISYRKTHKNTLLVLYLLLQQLHLRFASSAPQYVRKARTKI